MAPVASISFWLLLVNSLAFGAAIAVQHGGSRHDPSEPMMRGPSGPSEPMMRGPSGPSEPMMGGPSEPMMGSPETIMDMACEPEHQLVFGAISYSNLGGLGPDDYLPIIQVTDVLPHSGKAVDLRVSNLTAYTPRDSSQNTIVDDILNINVKGTSEVELQFQFIDAATQSPETVGPLIVSVLDLDEAADAAGRETVTIMDPLALMGPPVLLDGSEVTVSADGLSFSSSKKGGGGNNPVSLTHLTEDQKNRTIAMVFHTVSAFRLKLNVASYNKGRNFMIAGVTNLVCNSSTLEVASTTTTATIPAVTTAPTTTTTLSTCAPPTYKPLFSTGSFGLLQPDKDTFNTWFQSEGQGIVRRECPGCAPTHQDVYFKRKEDVLNYDAYEGLLVTWRGDVGFHTDFDIYSSVEDALADTNPWQFCNGNDPGIGFPRDCGPDGSVSWQWTSLTRGGQADVQYSVYQAPECGGSVRSGHDEWQTLYSKGYGGDFITDAAQFNQYFQAESYGIVKRECSGCADTHKEVFFRRKTSPQTWDAYDGLLVTWRGDLGFHTDFDIYSTIGDALSDENPWQFCNGNDANIGFPRDCGPTAFLGWQWNSLTRGGQAEYRFSVYRGAVLLQEKSQPVRRGNLRSVR